MPLQQSRSLGESSQVYEDGVCMQPVLELQGCGLRAALGDSGCSAEVRLLACEQSRQRMCAACRQAVPQLLKKLQLAHEQVIVESTPRRLAVMVASVQAKQKGVEERVRGPPAKVRTRHLAHVMTVRRAQTEAGLYMRGGLHPMQCKFHR